MMASEEEMSSEILNFSTVNENECIDGLGGISKPISCVLCSTNISESDAAEPGKMDIFARLSPAFDIIVINKVASVTGCSSAELHERGNHICTSCHSRLLKLHTLETSADQERALLSELYRRGSTRSTTADAGTDHPPAPAPPPAGSSLLLVNDVEVRMQDDQVTAVPLTSTRRRQLLRQARSAERRFECKVCGKRFRAFSHRVEHMLIHVNETPWACELCPKTFRTKSARTAHQRVHAPAGGRFTCDVCERHLSDAAALRAHVRTHQADSKPYSCDTCQHKFARRKDHAVHVRQHTGERPHACSDCRQTFVSRSRLNRHLLLHRDKQFACGCGRAFRRRYEMQKHARSCGQPAAADGSAAVDLADPSSATAAATSAAVAGGQTADQTAALTYLPVYYQVVTPVTMAGGAAPMTSADGAQGTPLQQTVPQGQEQSLLPVVTY